MNNANYILDCANISPEFETLKFNTKQRSRCRSIIVYETPTNRNNGNALVYGVGFGLRFGKEETTCYNVHSSKIFLDVISSWNDCCIRNERLFYSKYSYLSHIQIHRFVTTVVTRKSFTFPRLYRYFPTLPIIFRITIWKMFLGLESISNRECGSRRFQFHTISQMIRVHQEVTQVTLLPAHPQ